jgi:hypothetical protein
MTDDEPKKAPTIGEKAETRVLHASQDADKWAVDMLKKSEHGYHGPVCQTCAGRYITLTIAFDAGWNAHKHRHD